MKTLVMIGLAAAAAIAVPASAASTGNGGVSVGDCISDGFYGNEPNIVDPFAAGGPSEQDPGTVAGRVVPSQSPGPSVTNPDGTVRQGASVGDVNQEFGGGALPAFCRALAG
jgi:hypothetical protein